MRVKGLQKTVPARGDNTRSQAREGELLKQSQKPPFTSHLNGTLPGSHHSKSRDVCLQPVRRLFKCLGYVSVFILRF